MPVPVPVPPGRDVGQHLGQLRPERRPHERLLVGAEPVELPPAVGPGDVAALPALPVAVLDAVALLEVAADGLEDREPGQQQEVAQLRGGGPLLDEGPQPEDGVEDAGLEHLGRVP